MLFISETELGRTMTCEVKKKIPSKLEVAPNALKMLDGVGEWMDGYPLDCYDY